jgi:hypothetical protein
MSDAPHPWPLERRARTKQKIDKEAARVAARLGASHVKIIAFFEDGEYRHLLDAGSSPMDDKRLYEMLLSAGAILDASGGKDVAIS